MTEKKDDLIVDVNDLREPLEEAATVHYYSKHQVRINPRWWALLFQDVMYRNIRRDYVVSSTHERLTIRTVWQGIDSRKVKDGPPNIFKTSIESGDHCWEWGTERLDLAETLHALVVDQLKRGVLPDDMVLETLFN